MILSMTAFAKFESTSLVWEIRAVNSRYLEADFRLPAGIRQIEPELRGKLRDVVARGKVDASLRLTQAKVAAAPEINGPNLMALLEVLEDLRAAAPGIGQPDPLELLRWPGVALDGNSADAALRTEAMTGFEQALDRLIENRATEGGRLDAVLREKLSALEAMVAAIRALAESFAPAARGRLLGRLGGLNVRVDAARLEQEVALLAQKADIAEELDRLVMHAEACRDCLDAGGPQGRRLDFLMQELNRESNTLTAKAMTSECAQRAVELKVVVEQMREQVQNVE